MDLKEIIYFFMSKPLGPSKRRSLARIGLWGLNLS